MERQQTDIPPEAKQAADRGDTIEAIRITREATGVRLKEAKDAVEAHAQGRPGTNIPAGGLKIPPATIVLLHQGNFIEAVKSTRIETGMGLKESKEAVERFLAEDPVTSEQFRAAGGRTGLGPRMIVAMALLMVAAVLGVIYLSGAWR
jgi:ribosomal protein L7/L12